MSELVILNMNCDVCGEPATQKVIFQIKLGNQLIPQKIFYCCSSEKCFQRLKEYAKERGELIKVVPLELRRQLENEFFHDVQYIATLEQIEQMILEQNAKCVNCGRPLTKGSIRSYDHKDGIKVEGFKEKQWVYFHCKHCGLDSALWKVIQNIQGEKQQ